MRSSPGKRQYTETLQIANVEVPAANGEADRSFAKSIGIAEEIAFAIAFFRLSRQF
ncbi:hypothetical protein [Mesorhizobium sangaii]|uniref:Uncharacterized protein n=1 Tax=Mesorhizobium sangaii TaxID=505389 RepID=A0A841PT62_9HYPH|nr:hypothetical protein [Mesorhizobium sangaii]MBB6413329.1 hypothetical protein [Mesorhizobium sangaii]